MQYCIETTERIQFTHWMVHKAPVYWFISIDFIESKQQSRQQKKRQTKHKYVIIQLWLWTNVYPQEKINFFLSVLSSIRMFFATYNAMHAFEPFLFQMYPFEFGHNADFLPMRLHRSLLYLQFLASSKKKRRNWRRKLSQWKR